MLIILPTSEKKNRPNVTHGEKPKVLKTPPITNGIIIKMNKKTKNNMNANGKLIHLPLFMLATIENELI